MADAAQKLDESLPQSAPRPVGDDNEPFLRAVRNAPMGLPLTDEERAVLLETLVQRAQDEGATDEEIRSLRSFAALVDSATPEEVAREGEMLRLRRELYGGDIVAEGRALRDGTHPLARRRTSA